MLTFLRKGKANPGVGQVLWELRIAPGLKISEVHSDAQFITMALKGCVHLADIYVLWSLAILMYDRNYPCLQGALNLEKRQTFMPALNEFDKVSVKLKSKIYRYI